jgi:hypothetical protein
MCRIDASAQMQGTSRSAHTLPCKKTTTKKASCETDFTILNQIVIIAVQAQLAPR